MGSAAAIALGLMVQALCWAYSIEASVVNAALDFVTAQYGACRFCILGHLFAAEEPSPPLWFGVAFGRSFREENPGVSPEHTELCQHLVWAALYTRGVRTRDDALKLISTERVQRIGQA